MPNNNINDARSVRFQKLAPKRTQKVLKALEVLGNCSNKANYVYNEDQVRKIFTAVKDKIIETELRFKEKQRIHFEL